MVKSCVSKLTLKRLPLYLAYLRSLPKDGAQNVSATGIAEAIGLNEVQVRKDLAQISDGGRPKIGYITHDLIVDIETFLGYNNTNVAVLVGVGNLGRALLSYTGFKDYGLEIAAGFDKNVEIHTPLDFQGKPILGMDKLCDLCRRMKIMIGIITVPASEAQEVCNELVKGGVRAIWNFTPAFITVPKNVLLQNENMALSLSVLSQHLAENISQED